MVAGRAALEAVFAANDIDYVIHFAGFKAVGESVLKPVEYYSNNLNTTLTRRLAPYSVITHKLSSGSQLSTCICFDEFGVDVESQLRTAPLDNGLVPGDELLALRLGEDHTPRL